jgi:[ribosomal protein S18]-alanine N-acetyltransferase
MLIRSATAADVPRMRDLECQAETAAHWAEREYEALFALAAPKRVALVAEDESGLRGFLIALCGLDDWEIENVVVSSDHRKEGIGTSLVHLLLEMAQESGIPAVLLEVRESNLPARGLYEKAGFTEIGRRRGYYRNPAEDALLLSFRVSDL